MSMKLIKQLFSLSLMAVALLGGVFDTSAHHAVLRFNLEEMTLTADRVFVGRCVGVEETEEVIAQGLMPVTRYTFEVERAIKGELPKQFTFRQLGHPARRALGKGGHITMHGRAVTPGMFLHGMSEYYVGEQVILFLIPNYMGGKVTYPVGLHQGAFDVSEMPSGQKLVRNSINNLGLFTSPYNGTKMNSADAKVISPERAASGDSPGITPQSQELARKRGALPLEDFLDLVEQINIAHGGERGVIINTGKGAILQ